MLISILLCTYKRSDILKKSLESYCSLEVSDFDWEILVCDNANDKLTKELVENYQDRLPIKYYIEPSRGMNKAFNRIIDEARGQVIVTTGDDIIVSKNWLLEVYNGVNNWPKYSIFGGKILPYNSGVIPEEYKRFDSYSYLYAVANWDIEEGEYDFEKIFGGNMIVRASIFKDNKRFDEELGPGSGNYIAGGETSFLARMHELGHKFVYLPKAIVYHQIRQEQTSFKWILGRGFRGGRAIAWAECKKEFVYIFGVPRYVYRAYIRVILEFFYGVVTLNRYLTMHSRYKLSYFNGYFYQCFLNLKGKHSLSHKRI